MRELFSLNSEFKLVAFRVVDHGFIVAVARHAGAVLDRVALALHVVGKTVDLFLAAKGKGQVAKAKAVAATLLNVRPVAQL